jgi:hypothetical protein
MEATFLRFLLAIYFAAAFVGAIFYLRHRRAVLAEYILWGTVALAVPVLGPFLVIAARPGPRKTIRKRLPQKQVV